MLAMIFMLKSTLLSKPTSFDADLTVQSSTKSTGKKLNEDEAVTSDLIRFVHRESALRYSIIGNWLQYVVSRNFDDDQIELVERLKMFNAENDVCYFYSFLCCWNFKNLNIYLKF